MSIIFVHYEVVDAMNLDQLLVQCNQEPKQDSPFASHLAPIFFYLVSRMCLIRNPRKFTEVFTLGITFPSLLRQHGV